MGAFLGLLAGLGALLVWHGLTARPSAARPRTRSTRTREHLIQAGLPGVTPAQLIALQVLAFLLVGVLGLALTQSISVTLVFALFAASVPRLVVSRLRHKRQADLRELWPEVVDNLTSGVRAGLSLPEALSAIGVRGPEQLREPFRQFGSDYRTTGRFNDSLDRLKDALADPVGDRVCESLRVAREVGGTDLGRLLSTLSGFLRDDARTRAELLARQSLVGECGPSKTAYDFPMRAVVYARISSDRTGEHAGIDRQIADCESLAERRGWTIVGRFIDNDVSAFSGRQRPEFLKLLKAIGDGNVDIVVAYHVDRLYRRLRDLVPLLELCEKTGATVATVQAGSLDLATASGRVVASILGAVAEG